MRLVSLLCATFLQTVLSAQGNIMLLPFEGKNHSEDVLVYRQNNGAFALWQYQESSDKMVKVAQYTGLPATPGIGDRFNVKALVTEHSEISFFSWNPDNGQSIWWNFDEAKQQLVKAPEAEQLPSEIGLGGQVQMCPFTDTKGQKAVICWNTQNGHSVFFRFDKLSGRFTKENSANQIPEATGLSGKIRMQPFIDKKGNEAILIWEAQSGKSVSYFFDSDDGKWQKADVTHQLPANPGVSDNVMMYPYIGSDKNEVILVWSDINGAAMMWYFDDMEGRYIKAKSDFQLPTNTGIVHSVMMIPFMQPHHDEKIFIWNATTGYSTNYYFNDKERKYIKSDSEYQLPANPLQ